MSKKISVIVPIYNVETLLPKCLDSICNQTYRNLEIILVNDGSTDNSLSVCKTYCKADSRITLINQKNSGVSSARNSGLQIATGDFISFIDPDDWLDIHMYSILLDELEKQQADIIQCGFYSALEKTKENIPNTVKEQIYLKDEALKELIWDKNIKSYLWNKLYKSSLLKDIIFPVGKVYEDTYTTYKIFLNANKIVSISRPLYYYFIREGSITRSFSTHLFYGIYQQYTDLKEYSAELKPILQARLMKRGMVTSFQCIKRKQKTDAKEIYNMLKDLKNVIPNCSSLTLKEKIVATLYFYLFPIIL